MTTNENINNDIFAYTFGGVILFIAALAVAVIGLLNTHMASATTVVLGVTMAAGGISLLSKAISEERSRFKKA